MQQLSFAYPHESALGRADFFVSACNQAALTWVERWPEWPCRALVIHGPAGCGKTHLGRLWRGRASALALAPADLTPIDPILAVTARRRAVLVDDAEHAPEQALLHLYNWCLEQGADLLLLARAAPAAWGTALADLASRLRAVPAVAIEPPDDALLAAVLVKLFADRQVRVAPDVPRYLVSRIERSFAAAAEIVAALDRRAMRDQRAIKLPLVREVLGDLPAQSETPSDFGVT